MTGKPLTGKSFGGCVRYLVNKPEATILEAEGVRVQSARSITQDFDMQRKMRPSLGRAVGHSMLSWSALDRGKLSDGRMVEVAKEYMEKMGIRDTQYVIVKHGDREHPHIHIIYNRVDNKGKPVPDSNNYGRNVKVCRAITDAHGFHLGKGKDQVNRQALRGREKVRYAIYDAVKSSLKTARNWEELESELARRGIGLLFKYKGETGGVQGISLEKDGVKFKGSAIDRGVGFAGMDRLLRQDDTLRQTRDRAMAMQEIRPAAMEKPAGSIPGIPIGKVAEEAGKLLDTLLESSPAGYGYDPIERELKRKKRKRRKGISR